ncbi:MAG: hypothetical protein KIG88_00770 [Weeksellaceae bacterium]|nr:hypothetical protein [Weeksellaceae bacterium]
MEFVKTDDGKRGSVQAMDGTTEAGAMNLLGQLLSIIRMLMKLMVDKKLESKF